MTQTPAGWYPDPSPQNVDGAGVRYWDGNAWTEQVNHPGQGYPTYPTYPAQPQSTPYYAPTVASTPDGQPLAGWWMRVLATFLDWIFMIPVIALATAPVIINQWGDVQDWYHAHEINGTFKWHSGDTLPAVFDATTSPGLVFFLCLFVASALYSLVFLGWKQATPGKLAAGLRIRLRESPGLPWSAILPRWGVVTVLTILGQLPTAGTLFGLLLLLDYLWPLWDKNKQALHDKIARTNVVKKA
jgi:uncharacterized RDD family membrane protein YckC